MMFLPLSMTTLGSLPKEDIAAGTALYSLTRQLGGSVGVALLSTILGARSAFHRSIIASHHTETDPQVQARLSALIAGFAAKSTDLGEAKRRAVFVLDGAVRIQSSVLAFNDMFFLTAMLVLTSIPLIFVLGKPRTATRPQAGH
jgi:DHA2 family multidrug resistance protein